MQQETFIQIARHILGITIVWTMLIAAWFALGGDTWRELWAWMIEPYVPLWDRYYQPFFSHGYGRAAVMAIGVILVVVMVLRFGEFSKWVAKQVAGFVLAYLLVYAFTVWI